MARHYVPQGGNVYDIGCATGNMGRVLAGTLNDRQASLIAIDDSEEMVAKYEAPGEIVISKAEDFNYEPFDLAICFLTLMFIPLEDREALLYELDSKRRLGGAIIVVDKFEPEGGYLATAQWRLTLAGKCQAGVDPAEILEKEMSLVGVQRPTPAWMMRSGTEFFRFGDFRGYVIEGQGG
jgi:tRNA (cmo5U34)-methyltransferase